ncbi:MAG: prepilin-type N-terminal cleavage/methylation domain-containing protein [Elusimicrobiaceae bacterium]|nr:prepilin-type N-terminal cleavage/methylation domain-containing protein [Elusimicrobiaceae bacterium]
MKHGYTLLELLVVVLIIGILSAVALPYYFNTVENARNVELKIFWGSQKNYAAGKQFTEEELTKHNARLQNAGLKNFTAQIVCREGAPEGTPCYEVVFTRNANAAAQYQITSVNNFRALACIPSNALGTSFCKARAKPNGKIKIGEDDAYLIH